MKLALTLLVLVQMVISQPRNKLARQLYYDDQQQYQTNFYDQQQQEYQQQYPQQQQQHEYQRQQDQRYKRKQASLTNDKLYADSVYNEDEEDYPPQPFKYEYGGVDHDGRHYAKTETKDEEGVVTGIIIEDEEIHF